MKFLSRSTASRANAFSVCASALLLSLGIATANAQTVWTPTATKALPLTNAVALGPLSSSAPVHIVVALKLQNNAALNSLIKSQATPGDPLYQTELTPQQFAAQFGPSASQVQAVSSYLTSQGFSNLQVEDNNLFISADGTAGDVASAFNTALTQYSLNGATVFANTAAAQVPSSLGGIVLSVLGLNNIVANRTGVKTAISKPALKFQYGPKDFQKAYNAGTVATGSATSVAIFAEGDLTGVLKDLKQFETTFNQPVVPVTVIQTGLPSPDVAGVDEWDLDSQSSTGIAGGVKHLYFYDATSLSDADLAIAFNRFVTQKLAKAGNASFGECDVFPYLSGAMFADDQVFAQAAAQGQTIFASTGDVGASCPVQGTNGVPDSGPPMTSYPASSPYVVAVGGTTLFVDSTGAYDTEVAWNAGGGGISALENTTFWQQGVVPGGNVGKGLPDISMDADPNTGASLIVNGAPAVVGGTSLSSPLSMGVWARLVAAHKGKLGFASPILYKLAAGTTLTQQSTANPVPYVGGFNDVTVGTNGAYVATPGWDFTTGLGTFDITKVNAMIK